MINNNKTVNILYANVRSMRQNFDKIKLFIMSSPIDYKIVVLTETWISENELPIYQIADYIAIIQQRSHKRSGGVIVYVSKYFTCNTIKKVANINHESILFEVEAGGQRRPLRVLATYRNCRSPLDQYTQFLCNLKEHFDILIGDINQDILECNQVSADGMNYVSQLESRGYTSLVNEATRETDNAATCIDHCFVKTSVCPATCQVLDIGISDHKSIAICVKKPISAARPQSYNFCDLRTVKSCLETTNWSEMYDCDSVEEVHKVFTRKINDAQMAATETRVITSRNRKRKEWINQQLIDKCKRKNMLYKLCRKYPFSDTLKREKTQIEKELKIEIKIAKTQFYKNLYDNANTTKEFWKITNSILAGKNSSKAYPKLIELDNNSKIEVSGNECVVSNLFNTYFAGIADQLLMEDEIDLNTTPHLGESSDTSMYFGPLTMEEVSQSLNKIKAKKSSGSDGISTELLKYCKEEIIVPLSYLCKMSLCEAVFPSGLKDSTVIPIHKSGKPEKIENYRPLYINSSLAKVLEVIVQRRLSKYLNSIEYFSSNQYGFRSKMGTHTALAAYTKRILEALDSSAKVVSCHIDLKKCFDLINRRILLLKLRRIGVHECLLKWMKSYLSDRTQCTKFRSAKSKLLPLPHGILQGSSLGPLLFLIYINEACNLKCNGDLLFFADDAALICTESNYTNLYANLNSDIVQLMNWFREHKLVPNFLKTELIEYTYNRTAINPYLSTPMTIHLSNCSALNCKCQSISHVKTAKYLGVLFDSHLTWKETTTCLYKSLRHLNVLFYSLKKFMPTKAMIAIYRALYESKLQYSIFLWGSAAQTYVKPIITSQKFAVRSIMGQPRLAHTCDIFKKLNILPVPLLHKKVILSNFLSDPNPNNCLIRRTRQACTGYLKMPKFSKAHTQNSFLYKSIACYNEFNKKYISSGTQRQKKKYLSLYIASLLENYNYT